MYTNTGAENGWFTGGDWNRLKDLVFDTARSKMIDVETTSDDQNMPDRTDVRHNMAPAPGSVAGAPAQPQVGTAAPLFSGPTGLLVLAGLGVGAYFLMRG